jgi:hypothetical protein
MMSSMSYLGRDCQTEKARTVDFYDVLCGKNHTLIQCPKGKIIRKLFDSQHLNSEVSELKKIDLVLWQIRS